VRDDAVADEVVRAFHFNVVDIFFGGGLNGNNAVPGRAALRRGNCYFHSLF